MLQSNSRKYSTY